MENINLKRKELPKFNWDKFAIKVDGFIREIHLKKSLENAKIIDDIIINKK